MDQKDSFSTGTELHVRAASRSDIGRVRKHNEDAIALCEPPDQTRLSQLGRLYLLADGAGGHAAGEVASQVAVETIAATYYVREPLLIQLRRCLNLKARLRTFMVFLLT